MKSQMSPQPSLLGDWEPAGCEDDDCEDAVCELDVCELADWEPALWPELWLALWLAEDELIALWLCWLALELASALL